MTLRNLLIWAVIVVVLVGLYSVLNQGASAARTNPTPYSELLKKVDDGSVRSATISGEMVEAKDAAGKSYLTVTPSNQDDLVRRLEAKGASIDVKRPNQMTIWTVLINSLPILLLIGPPGTGKTLLARAIAGEAGVPFFTISGSDFVEMFVGVGASRVRDMFEQAKKNAPCIIFIDEIDAVGRHRGAGLGGGNDEREQTLNQLLVEMDGFEANEGIILVAATNRPDVLDPALLRPGRFDRQVVVPNPDLNGREKILRVHMRNVPLSPDVNVKTIARGTPGFSGADLANLVNEAALTAARKNRRMVTQHDFEQAKDKVMMGAERKSMAMSDEEKRLTAYHEGGHALVALSVPCADPVHKATIIPRGRALGMVMQLPEADRYSMKYQQMTSSLTILMGGRVAEELIFGKENVTSGASSDIEQATRLARAMVTRWGFSDKLGVVAYGENQEEVFLGHSVARTQNVSAETAKTIDSEIKRLVQGGYDEARSILTTKLDDLHTIAKALLEFETLSGDEIIKVMQGIQPVREATEEKRPAPASVAVPLTHAPEPGPQPA